MTASHFLPVITVVLLAVGRRVYPILEKLITWTTVGLMSAWALLSVLDGLFGRPVMLDEGTLVVGYAAIASFVLNAVAVVFHVGKRLADGDAERPTVYARVVRIASIAGVAVVIYILSAHRS